MIVTVAPPDEKEKIEILADDKGEDLKTKKNKLAAQAANKKGCRDLVMSTDGILLNIVENPTSNKLTKGDLIKAWGRLERRWNLKTREDKVEVYTKFLSYKLENTRQKPMDWLAFMEKKRTELMRTGHRMDNETFIPHLVNSLPQSESKGVIKDKLRNGNVELPEIEQILDDKYQAMKHDKGWGEEEDDYALFPSPSNKKKLKKTFKGFVGTVGSLDIKQLIVPTRKVTKIRVRKPKPSTRKNRVPKGTPKEKGIEICPKLSALIAGNMDIFSHDCLKSCNNANIAEESEQNNKVENMLDLDSTSVCKECAMMCTELQHEDVDEDLVVYGDQGTNTEEYEKAMYGNLTKTQSEEEDEVIYNVAQSANDSVLLERKRRQLNESTPDEKVHGVSQSDTSINENHREISFNKLTMVVQGPSDHNDKNESQKSWTMEMLTNDGDISMSMMNEPEQVTKEDKKFLYARAVHSNHSIQYHMQQIIE